MWHFLFQQSKHTYNREFNCAHLCVELPSFFYVQKQNKIKKKKKKKKPNSMK